MTDERPRIRVAFIDEQIYGLGPHGRATTIEPGAYQVAELDGMDSGQIMLKDENGVLLAIIPQEYAHEIISTANTRDPIGWAKYRRRNRNMLASWGEQNDRMAPEEN